MLFAVFGHITALDVAFATAIVTGVVGLLSPVSAAVTGRSQRKADRNARIYNDKRDAYRDTEFDGLEGRKLLDVCSEALAVATDAQAVVLVTQLKADVIVLNSTESKRLSNFGILASDKVKAAQKNFIEVWNASVEPLWAINQNQAGYAALAKAMIDGALTAIEKPLETVRTLMRDDLCG